MIPHVRGGVKERNPLFETVLDDELVGGSGLLHFLARPEMSGATFGIAVPAPPVPVESGCCGLASFPA